MLNKLTALLLILSICAFSTTHAQYYCDGMGNSANGGYLYSSDTGGCGYEECRQAPNYTAAIILGAIALGAIVAMAIQQTSDGGHFH